MVAAEHLVNIVIKTVPDITITSTKRFLMTYAISRRMPDGDQIARPAQIDRRVVVEHVEPDAMSLGKLLCAESGTLHFFQKSGDGAVAVDRHRPRRNRQEF